MKTFFILKTWILWFFIAPLSVLFVAASPIKHHDKCRENAINATLNMTLLVGAEMREKHLHPSWGDIQKEVRKRLGVK